MDADELEFEGQVGPVHHWSKRVRCMTRGQPAVVSVIERTDANGVVRFVLWCSLRAADECDEQCLRTHAVRAILREVDSQA